ncbi:hypothetical protein ACS3UN_04790 [Oscillospiraceae bacterium LTW-04]|nr:hypothetical protein RBH76_05575 [Oscillospiraceae bacterium MB24-C1]
MNENNGANFNASETVTTLPPPVPQKKAGKSKLLIGAAAVCAIAAVAAVIKFSSTPDPKTTVEAAFTATAEQQQIAVDKIYQKIPAAKLMFEGRSGAMTTDFDFKLNAIEDNPYAAFANAILKDAGIRGSASSDPAQQTAAFNASVYLKDAPMIEAHAFMSPELIVAGVPTFSQTALSINPTTFAQDYTGSVLNAVYPIDAQSLDMMQGVITGEIEYINAISAISYEKMLADITPIFKNALTNATYTYDKQNKKYVVDIPGEDLKSAVLDYYRYIYFESEFGVAIEKMVTSAIDADPSMTYEGMMNEAISSIDESLPDMDAKLTLDIKSGLIKSANLVCTPVAAASSSESAEVPEIIVNSFVFDCTFDDAVNTAKLVIATEDAMNITMDATSTFSNDTYATDMTVGVESSFITFNMPLNISVAADGAYSCVADMNIDADGDLVNAGFAFNGTAVLENDALTVSLPDSRIYASASDTAVGALVFDIDYTNAPLTEALTAPESTSLFELDAQQLEQLNNEYSVGYESLVGQLYSLLMG